MPYFIYILECSNGNYYTGYTTDIARRYQEHLEGSTKCKYTRSFPPKCIAAHWSIDTDLSQTLKIEYKIKQLSKTEKQRLINNPELFGDFLVPSPSSSLPSPACGRGAGGEGF